MCAGLAVCIPNDVYAANGDAAINTVASQNGWIQNSDGSYSVLINNSLITTKLFS